VVVVPSALQWDDYPVYSAYPGRTVIDIVGPRKGLAPQASCPGAARIDFGDVQGNILRGFHADMARHYALTIESAQAAREFLAALVTDDGTDCPRVTSAEAWETGNRPPYFMNVGVTAAGLSALGIPDSTMRALPDAFLQGPAEPSRAAANGDVGAGGPEHWELGGPGQPAHLLVSLYGDNGQGVEFGRRARQLEEIWARGGLQILIRHDANAMPDDKVHFGYRDGIAQPRIAGVHPDTGHDMQPRSSAGEFLLGAEYKDIYGGSSLGDLPASLCQNATFAAVRVLEQDVGAFERLLESFSTPHAGQAFPKKHGMRC
jgi:deferrochelatase/peroxidase EfeB